MVTILADCLETAFPSNQELVELLAKKLVFEESSEDEDGDANGEVAEEDGEDESSDEELMMDTQEAPKLKEKKRAKKRSLAELEVARKQANFAGDVLKSAHRVVEPAIGGLLHADKDGIFGENLELLISRLAEIRPSLVSLLLPELQDRVTDVTIAVRQKVVSCLSTLFLASGFHMACLDYNHIFTAFVGRFKDHDIDIRARMVEFAQAYLLSSAPSAGIHSVRDALKERINLEREPQIRAAAIEAVGSVACDPHGINKLDLATLKSLVPRALDKSEAVRRSAAFHLSAIYSASLEQLLSAMESDAETKEDKRATTRQEVEARMTAWKERYNEFVWEIPSVIIERLFATELSFDERAFVDDFITHNFLSESCLQMTKHKVQLDEIKSNLRASTTSPTSKSSKKAAKKTSSASTNGGTKHVTVDPADFGRHIVLQASSLTDRARKAFTLWMHEKKTFRDELKVALATNGEAQRQSAFQTVLEKRIGVKKPLQLTELLRSDLDHMIDPSSSDKRLKSVCEAFRKHVKKSQESAAQAIVRKSCFSFFTPAIAKEFIHLLQALSSSAKAPKLSAIDHAIYLILCRHIPNVETQQNTTLDVIQRVAAVHPSHFAPHLDALHALLAGSTHEGVTKAIARISTFTAPIAVETDELEDRIKTLVKLAQSTERKIAAEAGNALLSLFSASEEGFSSSDEIISAQIKTAKGPLSDKIAPAFASLTPLAKLIDSRHALPLIHHTQSILRTALNEKSKTQLTAKNQANPAEYASTAALAAVEAIQFVVSWYRHLANRNHQAASSSNDALRTPSKSKTKTPAVSPFSPKSPARKGGKGPISPSKASVQLTRDQESTIQHFAESLGEIIKDDGNDLDHVLLRATACVGLIRLSDSRGFPDLLGVDLYLEMASMIMDEHTPELISNEISAALIPSINRLPLKFLPFLVVMQTESPLSLAPFIEERRLALKQKMSALMGSKGNTDERIARLKASTLPENAIPWLVYILAHANDLESDEPTYTTTCNYLKRFLSQLLTENNSNYILRILDDIRQVEDVHKPESNSIHLVAELGLNVMQQILAADKRKQKVGGAQTNESAPVFLPTQLFKLRYEEKEDGKLLVKVSSNIPSLLPASFRSPGGSLAGTPVKAKKTRAKTSSAKRKSPGAKRKRATKYDDYEDDDEEGDMRSDTSEEEEEMDVDDDDDNDNKSDADLSAEEEEDEEMEAPASKRRAAVVKASSSTATATSPKTKKTSNTNVSSAKKAAVSTNETSPTTKKKAPVRRAKKGGYGLNRDIFGSISSDDEDEEDIPAPPTRSKRPTPSAKLSPPKPKHNAMDEDKEDEDPDEEPPVPKRPKRAAATPQSTQKAKTTSSKKLSSEDEVRSEDMSVEEEKPASRTRAAQAKSAASTPARPTRSAHGAKVSASATKTKRK
jgi:hypothetical protein